MSTEDNSNIIKNPNRKEHSSVEKYIPEYIRLNKEPQIEKVDQVALRTFALKKQKKRKVMEANMENNKVLNDDLLRIVDPFEHENELPKQFKPLNVGSNKNWMEDPIFDKPNVDLNNKELEVEDFDESFETKEEISISVFDCVPGTYVLFVEKESVFSSFSKEEIEAKVEEILFVDQKYKNINVNDIFILKKVPVRIGAALME